MKFYVFPHLEDYSNRSCYYKKPSKTYNFFVPKRMEGNIIRKELILNSL